MSKITDFFRTEYKKLVRFVRYLIDDTAERDAEDIVQDVMLNIFNKADITEPIENLSAYIYQSLRHRVIDVLRKKKDAISLSGLIHDVRSDTVHEVEKKEIQEQILRAMDSLSDDQRAIIIATEFEGRSYRELAEEWQIPIGTLLARKSRALEKMRHKLTGLV
jgi:RNA polymerase sigma factor (sigma-70 family)